MHPVLLFTAGLITGIAGVRLIKKGKGSSIGASARRGVDQARGGLRDAALGSLDAVDRGSAALRSRLAPAAAPAPEAAADDGSEARP